MAGRSSTPRDASSPNHGSTRKRLLEAAYQLLVDQGYQATTVQGIARRANLTTGAIYANFANKHELLVLAALDRWMTTGLAGSLDVPVEDSRMMDVMVRHLSAAPAPEHRLLTEVTGASLRDRTAEHLLREGAEQVAALARRAIEEARDNGVVNEQMPIDAWVALTVNLFLGAITSKTFDLPQPDPEDVRALLTGFIQPWRPADADADASSEAGGSE